MVEAWVIPSGNSGVLLISGDLLLALSRSRREVENARTLGSSSQGNARPLRFFKQKCVFPRRFDYRLQAIEQIT